MTHQSQRARQQNSDAYQSITPSMPKPLAILTAGAPFNVSPFIRGFQDNMTTWMSSLIKHWNGCKRVIAQQASLGRLRQEQLEQAVAMCAPRAPSPDRDQVQYLRDHLAHRETNTSGQIEIIILPKKKNYLHRCVYSAVKHKNGDPEWSVKWNKY